MTLDVVIRTHAPARGDELGRAVFSAALQDVEDVAIHVVCQRFTGWQLAAVRAELAPVMALAPRARLLVHNRSEPTPEDARAALLNIGIAAATGRYLAFLDYDDLIYPEGWRRLIEELQATGAAIAFGAVVNATVERDGLVPYVAAKRRVFSGEGLGRLLWNNFCPLHSFVLDRAMLPWLHVDETMTALEDYAMLLEVVSRAPSTFRLKERLVGEYLMKDDGSNSNPLATAAGAAGWALAEARIAALKDRLVLAPMAQAQLGLDEPGLTVAGFLARHGDFA